MIHHVKKKKTQRDKTRAMLFSVNPRTHLHAQNAKLINQFPTINSHLRFPLLYVHFLSYV